MHKSIFLFSYKCIRIYIEKLSFKVNIYVISKKENSTDRLSIYFN